MSPSRPKVTDHEIFAAAQRAMTRRGPHELTLADIAREAGVSAGRLVQRFGSKRGLFLTLAERFAGSARTLFTGLRSAHPPPLATLRAYASCMAGLAVTPAALARNLAWLQIDLTDPDLRAHLVANARATRRQIEALLRSAVQQGALEPGVDTKRLARTVETAIGGSLMSWACYQEGSAEKWIRRDLDAVLEPHLAPPRRSRTTARRPSMSRRRKG